METDLSIKEQELIDLCRSGDYQTIDSELSSASKRSINLSRTALKLFQELSDSSTEKQRIAVLLGILYTTSNAELVKLRFGAGYFNERVINREVLRSLPRDRLQVFAERLLDTSTLHFKTVTNLFECGLLDKPRSNGYIAGLIASCSWPNKNRNGLAECLLSKAHFTTDDVWLLFRFDGTAESCLAGADKYLTNREESWQTVLVAFSKQGILDRQRLLDESLGALSCGFNQFRASWFSRFHEALEPTVSERVQRSQSYVRLLNSTVSPTVSFALTAILSIDKASPFAFRDLAAPLAEMLSCKSKQTVLAALKLLERCADREPSERKAICLVACTALLSNHAEVQSKVINLIAKIADQHDSALKQCLVRYMPALSASVKANLPRFFQSIGENVSRMIQHDRPPLVESSAPKARILTPINNLDDLVLKAAFVLEHPEAYCDYELVLDGILRNCALTESDFGKRTAPLLQRAQVLYRKTGDADTCDTLIRSLCRLIITWVTDECPDDSTSSRPWLVDTAFRALHRLRMQAITERVRSRLAMPLLSLPTDEFGWLEPDDLWARLKFGVVNDDPWDKCFALLRLRTVDDNSVESITGNSKHPAVLFARSRLQTAESRENLNDWLIEYGVSLSSAFISLNMKPKPSSVFPTDMRNLPAQLHPHVAQEVLLEGSLVPNLQQQYFASGAWRLLGCLQYTRVPDKAARFYLHFLQDHSISPGKQGSLLLVLAVSTDDQDISMAGIDTFIMLIAQQRLDFTSTATAMNALFRHGDCVQANRCCHEFLATNGMSDFLRSNCIKANRWAKNFSTIAKASPEHSHLVYRLLQHVLSTPLAVPPRDLHFILELLVELQAEHGGTLQPEAIACLTRIKSSGKTKKLVDHLTRSGGEYKDKLSPNPFS